MTIMDQIRALGADLAQAMDLIGKAWPCGLRLDEYRQLREWVDIDIDPDTSEDSAHRLIGHVAASARLAGVNPFVMWQTAYLLTCLYGSASPSTVEFTVTVDLCVKACAEGNMSMGDLKDWLLRHGPRLAAAAVGNRGYLLAQIVEMSLIGMRP